VSQVIDYAIARRIVDLHSGSMEDMERVYTTEEIQRYIIIAVEVVELWESFGDLLYD